MVRIAIDAGHGLTTAGREVPAYLGYGVIKEWVLNDRIVVPLIEKLKKYEGVEILRLDDPTGATDVPLERRTSLANSWGADLLISNHHNSGIGGGSGGGLVVYRYPNSTLFSTASQTRLYNLLIEHVGLRGNRSTPIAEANFHMVREGNMPSVLIEYAFMDSPSDMAVVMSPGYPERSATAVTQFVVEEFNLQKRVVAPGVVARVHPDKTLSLQDEIVEYPPVIEGSRNFVMRDGISVSGAGASALYSESNFIEMEVSGRTDGIYVPATNIMPNTDYVMSFTYRVRGGALVSFGGHTDATWSDNVASIDGVERGPLAESDSVFIGHDFAHHNVEVHIRTPSTVLATDRIFIQPNRLAETFVMVEISNWKIEKGVTPTPYTPAPEDFGLQYDKNITNFKPGLTENGQLLTRAFWEGGLKPVSWDRYGEVTLHKLNEDFRR